MARETMTQIISELRLLTGDSAGVSQVFSDDDLQSVLDKNREFRNYTDLQPVSHVLEGEKVNKTFISEDKYFESDTKIYDSDFIEIIPSASDFINARWDFAEHYLFLSIRGFCYDLYGAGADICEAWMQKVKFDFDFGADQQNYNESQKFSHLKELANTFREKAVFIKKTANSAGIGAYSSTDWSSDA